MTPATAASRSFIFLLWAGCALALLFPMPGLEAGRVADYARDFLHVPLFALLTWSLWRTGIRRAWALAAVFLAMGLVEVIQPWVGREAEARDALFGAAGSAMAVALSAAFRTPDPRKRAAWRSLVLVLGAAVLLPLWLVMLDRWEARREFPVLASFRAPLETGRWKGQGCSMERVKSAGRSALRLTVLPGADYPGVFLVEAPRDWTGMRCLEITMAWPGPGPREFWVRADDRPGSPPYADRVQAATILQPGVQRWSIPRDVLSVTPGGRPFDFSRVVSLGVFMGEGRAGEGFDLLEVRLAPGTNRPGAARQ